MFVPQSYLIALLMMIVTMICWGSWANTFKLTKKWRFELFYWDYVIGVFLISIALAFTLGSIKSDSPSFIANIKQADSQHIFYALLAGIIFNIANILLVAAIDIAGLAVAFPIAIGLALVIGVVLSYIIMPIGDPVILFIGVVLICLAIIFDALAYKNLPSQSREVTKKGIIISLMSGITMGAFPPFVAKAFSGTNSLDPYSVAVCFSIGILMCNIPLNYLFMRKPLIGAPVKIVEYFRGIKKWHILGLLGGIIWGLGTAFNFAAANLVGVSISYAFGQGATMIAAIWGIFIWKEFRDASSVSKRYLTLMFILYIIGLTIISLAYKLA